MEKKLNILIGILSIATFGAWIFNKKNGEISYSSRIVFRKSRKDGIEES